MERNISSTICLGNNSLFLVNLVKKRKSALKIFLDFFVTIYVGYQWSRKCPLLRLSPNLVEKFERFYLLKGLVSKLYCVLISMTIHRISRYPPPLRLTQNLATKFMFNPRAVKLKASYCNYAREMARCNSSKEQKVRYFCLAKRKLTLKEVSRLPKGEPPCLAGLLCKAPLFWLSLTRGGLVFLGGPTLPSPSSWAAMTTPAFANVRRMNHAAHQTILH